MFGNLSPFFTIWGPATATQGGILTTSAQTIAGAKTFTGAMVINQTSQAGAAETPLTISIGDDAASYIKVVNGSTVDGRFVPFLSCKSITTATGITIQGRVVTDSGANEAVAIQGITDAAGSLATRPILGLYNNVTNVLQVSAAGALVITGGSAPGLTVGASGTKITQTRVYSQTITPASVAANTTAEQTFTVTGLTTADKVTINPGAAPTAGTGIVGVRVSAADTLAVTYANNTAGALTPVSSTCLILATRS